MPQDPNDLGDTYRLLGNYAKAIEYYQQELAITRNIEDAEAQKRILNQLAEAYRALGEHAKAVGYCHQELVIGRKISGLEKEAERLFAEKFQKLSKFELQEALYIFVEYLAVSRKLGDRHKEAKVLYNIGSVYQNLGQDQKAREFYEQFLAIREEISDRKEDSKTLANIGSVYSKLGQEQKALEYYEEALAMSNACHGIILNNIGSVYSKLGQEQKALEYYEEASVFLQKKHCSLCKNINIYNLGETCVKLGQYEKALKYYEQALAIPPKEDIQEYDGILLRGLGTLFLQTGKFAEATEKLVAAIEVWESLRPGLTDTNKVSLFEKQVSTYRLLQIALIAQNKILGALEIAERGRARAFVDLLTQRFGSQLADELERQFQLAALPKIEQIQQIAKEQKATLVEYAIVTWPKSQEGNRSEIYIWVIQPTGAIAFRSVDLTSLNVSLKDLVTDTRELIGVRDGSSTQQLAIVSGDLVRLNDDAPDWEPWEVVAVDAESGILSLAQSSFPKGVTIPRPVTDVKNKVESRHTHHPRLQQLHQLLIEPIADLLPTDPKAHVIFIPQKELFLVPFPALQDASGKYLIEKHTILTAPAIQVLELTHQQGQRDSGSAKDILIVGNPTMPKISLVPGEPARQLASLPHSETEALEIARLLQTTAIIGDRANKAAIVTLLPNAKLIHLATHGLLDDRDGIGSAIALAPSDTDNGLLTAEEILQLNLNADLVVLSACNTGQGRITGDGIIGLSRALICAGVPSVIVSLWSVPDSPTAALMTEFYQNFQYRGDKAQALRQAMLTTMQQHPNPRDWAAFTLIGFAQVNSH
ncbi:CHAT domain-containing protein [Argonema antarcticum]|uniref:CHAT domain-containing protein n=1 Tax=Argonema antarcticum TaxID=2942763 RepID=UPI002011A2A4|nr:CHAT domain-containing tetratricopeptide repeat protein [Argonema antarcticum]MCL1475382.1 CHAT domain-containing protein [Argonema antarcticum A004/B2]